MNRMNAKKCKAIRRSLKAKGLNFRDAQIIKRNIHFLKIQEGTNSDGTPRIIAQAEVYTGWLAPLCGRKVYKQLKKVAA